MRLVLVLIPALLYAQRLPSNPIAAASTYLQKARDTSDFSYIDRASALVDASLEADPGNYNAVRLRTEIALERHQFTLAAGYSEELTRIAPEDPWNWGTLGDSLMEMGEYGRAGAAYARMLSLRPNQASYNRAAHYRWVTGDAQAAIELMRQAVSAGGHAPENSAWCFVELGAMLFKTDRQDEAHAAFQAALDLMPDYHPARAGVARIKARRGDLAGAIEEYRRAQSSVPLPEYAAALHDLYLRAGKQAQAKQQLAMLDVVYRLAQASGETTDRKLAVIYADLGIHLDRAWNLIQEELKVRQDVFTYDALAWIEYKRGNRKESREALRRALSLGTPEPDFHRHAALITAN